MIGTVTGAGQFGGQRLMLLSGRTDVCPGEPGFYRVWHLESVMLEYGSIICCYINVCIVGYIDEYNLFI